MYSFSRAVASVLLLCLVAPAERTLQASEGSEALVFNGKGMNAFQRVASSRSHRRGESLEPDDPPKEAGQVGGDKAVKNDNHEYPVVSDLFNQVEQAKPDLPAPPTDDEVAAMENAEHIRKAFVEHNDKVEKVEDDMLKQAADATGHKEHEMYTDFVGKVLSIKSGKVKELVGHSSDVTGSNHKSGLLSNKYSQDLMKLANQTSHNYHKAGSLSYEAYEQIHGGLSRDQLDEEKPIEIVMPVEQVEFEKGQLTPEAKNYLRTVFVPEAEERMKSFLEGDYHLTFCIQASTAVDPEALEAEERASHGKEDSTKAATHLINDRNRALQAEVKEVLGSAPGDKPEYQVDLHASDKETNLANFPLSSVMIIAKRKNQKTKDPAECPAKAFDAVKASQPLKETIDQIVKQEKVEETEGKALEREETQDADRADIATAAGGWSWLTAAREKWEEIKPHLVAKVETAQSWASQQMQKHGFFT